jgi:hypothetical protein
MERLRVNFVVICDEVRREDNGKLFIRDIKDEGTLEFQIRSQGDEDWQTAARIPVVLKT